MAMFHIALHLVVAPTLAQAMPHKPPASEALQGCAIRPENYGADPTIQKVCGLRDDWAARSKKLSVDFKETDCKMDYDLGKIICAAANQCDGNQAYNHDLTTETHKMSFNCTVCSSAPDRVGCCSTCAKSRVNAELFFTRVEKKEGFEYLYDVDCIGCLNAELEGLVKDAPDCKVVKGAFQCEHESHCETGGGTKSVVPDKYSCAITPCGTRGCDDHAVAECCIKCLDLMCTGNATDRMWCEGCDKVPAEEKKDEEGGGSSATIGIVLGVVGGALCLGVVVFFAFGKGKSRGATLASDDASEEEEEE